MPKNKAIKGPQPRTAKSTLTEGKVIQLCCGHDLLDDGYGDLVALRDHRGKTFPWVKPSDASRNQKILDAMRRDYSKCKAALLAYHARHPDGESKPWAYRMFEPEGEQLKLFLVEKRRGD